MPRKGVAVGVAEGVPAKDMALVKREEMVEAAEGVLTGGVRVRDGVTCCRRSSSIWRMIGSTWWGSC